MRDVKEGARAKILRAAEEVAYEAGAGSMALDAVAARAGVSKGGLLYHFPSKAKLLEAMVQKFLSDLDMRLKQREAECGGGPNSVIQSYLDIFVHEHRVKRPPPSGILAALAEDPGFMNPVRHYERIFLDRIKQNATDPTLATLVFLGLHGIRSMELLTCSVIDEAELEDVVGRMRELVDARG